MAKAKKAAPKAAATPSGAAAADLPAIGMPFAVTETTEFTEGRRLIARYLPEFGYRVTALNQAFVGEMIAAGKAAIGIPGAGGAKNAPAATPAAARGTVRT